MGDSGEERVLRLQSPNRGALPLIYPWSEQEKSVKAKKEDNQDDVDPCDEILETIRLVSSEFPEMSDLFTDDIESVRRSKSWEDMSDIVERYNSALTRVLSYSQQDVDISASSKASVPLIQLIMRQIYNLVIEDPNKLNDYRGFSEEVYGEFKFPIISDMIKNVPITENDSFIDLGSGVGQIVLQAAAQSMCKMCYGIEKRSIPHEYAKQMEIAFKERMHWFGKPYGDFRIIQGDFLSEESQAIIKQCNIIFCNNYTFPSELNLKLKTIFEDLPDGTVIISSNNFCPLNFKISERNVNDIGAIMSVKKVTFDGEGVSWTDKSIDYYIHRIDKSRLFDFVTRRANGEISAGVSGMSGGSSDEGSSDEEFRPSKSSRGKRDSHKRKGDRPRGSRGVSPAAAAHSPKVRSPIAKAPRIKPADHRPAVPSELAARKAAANGDQRLKPAGGQSSQSLSRNSSLTKLQEKQAPAPVVPARAKQDLNFALNMYLAKQEAAIKDFLHKYDVSARHANLTAENAQLAERLATLEPAVDALRKDTHKLAHSTLCEALGVPPSRVTWGSAEQAAMVAGLCVEHERLMQTARMLKDEISELEASDPRANEEKRIKFLATSLKAFFKFMGQDIKTWKRKFELDTPEAADKLQADLRAELQKSGFPLEHLPKRPRTTSS